MVARNEAGRYLDTVLAALSPFVHEIHIYDDLSTDDTPQLATGGYGARVTRRPPTVPAFLAHEGEFRQAAWRAFEEELRPCGDDWVLCLDADEVLVAPDGLLPAINAAGPCSSVVIPIPEVFGLADDGTVLIRTDGFWRRLEAPRLIRYREGGLFRHAEMGCGSTPTYPNVDVQSMENKGVQLLHLGYLDGQDRIDKHNRYAGRTGHSAAHVSSILTAPTLQAWQGPEVSIWRGRR
jgi:glycosyltransferase involved in cell wall biosynthesis